MGPAPLGYVPKDNMKLVDDVRWLHRFEASEHCKGVIIITRPSVSPSGMWEVSEPGCSAMGFSHLAQVRQVMTEKYGEV
jgi:hypothetical protein